MDLSVILDKLHTLIPYLSFFIDLAKKFFDLLGGFSNIDKVDVE